MELSGATARYFSSGEMRLKQIGSARIREEDGRKDSNLKLTSLQGASARSLVGKGSNIPSKLMAVDSANRRLPTIADAEADIAAIVAALGLQHIRRYLDQKHWTDESALARAADEAEPGLKLENVAAHSWQVADATLLLAPHFSDIDAQRALQLAVLHDKLELITGDFDPVGTDGQGTDSHAFDPAAQAEKTSAELAALDVYLKSLREDAREQQRGLILEFIHNSSPEAQFVNSVDKLQALVFVFAKKKGDITDEHLVFSLRYSAKVVEYFPRLAVHYGVLVRKLLETVAANRRTSPVDVVEALPEVARAIARSSAHE